ncbi:hypothetical protein LR48_Vigan05g102800 [Vigna angularis]|nr:hypothetical protein LR48_Vigan05g102800 [Vigna angularis]
MRVLGSFQQYFSNQTVQQKWREPTRIIEEEFGMESLKGIHVNLSWKRIPQNGVPTCSLIE